MDKILKAIIEIDPSIDLQKNFILDTSTLTLLFGIDKISGDNYSFSTVVEFSRTPSGINEALMFLARMKNFIQLSFNEISEMQFSKEKSA